jgi:hypothetical protein
MRLLRRRATEPTASEGPRTGTATAAETAPGRRTGEAPAAGAERARLGNEPERAPVARRRRGLGWRTRDAGAATAGAVGSGVLVLARLVMTVAVLIALLIGLAIVLYDVDANASNTIVKGIHEGANFFASPFTGLITVAGHTKRELTIDWGIALLVYLVVGAVIASLIARIGYSGLRAEQRHRAISAH